MATFVNPGPDSTVMQTVESRSVLDHSHEQNVYTFEQYKTLMRKNLRDSKHKIRQELKQHLKDKLQNVSDRIIDELVTNILDPDPDRNVKLCSNRYSDVNYDDICREYKTRYNKIKEHNFLLIIASTKTENFNVDEDFRLRKMQYEQMFKDINNDDCLVFVEVKTRAELETIIKHFLSSTAKDALHAYIVFNGHGSSAGLVLDGEEHCYNLDEIIRFAERCFDDVDTQVPIYLPARVLVVFGQCYGHHHDQRVNNSRFNVHSFTNPTSNETHNSVVYFNTEVISSRHLQLETFIQEILKIHGSSRLNSASSEPMELSDDGISLSSSRSSFSSVSRCDSSSLLADSGVENMEVDDYNNAAFSDENNTKRLLAQFTHPIQ